MKINRIDVIWNYTATFFKISSSLLLIPFILHKLSSEDVGIWTIFSSISSLVFLVDFGFNSSFSRNVTYIFSGVSTLKKDGHEISLENEKEISFELLKGLLEAMRWFYSRISALIFVALSIIGTLYLVNILSHYQGNKINIYTAWFLFISINTYNLYTLYYDALLEGKGLIRISKKITILGHVIYLLVALIFIYCGYGLAALVGAQFLSVIIIRTISNKKFFTPEIINKLDNVNSANKKEILKAIYPNAMKYGVTSIGGFLIQKSSIFIGSLFLPLSSIASFGIAKQILDSTVGIANIALITFLPQISRLRILGNNQMIKFICVRGLLIANLTLIIGSIIIISYGNFFLHIIKSNTFFNQNVILIMAISSFISLNSGLCGAIISTKNYIPFMKPSLISGICTILLLIVLSKFTNLGLVGMAMAPGVIDLCYQGWKWPLVVFKDLDIKFKDFIGVLKRNMNNTYID